MFDFLKKKPSVPEPTEPRRPLNLPVLSKNNFNPETIAEYLKNDTPIWAWYNAKDMPMTDDNGNWNFNALLALENGRFDGFSMFRKEGNLICKYTLDIFNDGKELNLKLSDIREMKNSNILELCRRDLKEAYELYHDDENIASTLPAYVHDITAEKASLYIKDKRVYHVGEEHFYKKSDYPDGLPADAEE